MGAGEGNVILRRLRRIGASDVQSPRDDQPDRSFFGLKDPRQGWRVVYPLREILLLVLCGSLCRMEDFVEIRMWGELRLDFLRRFYPYERGLPAHDTLNDVLNALAPDVFQACFSRGVESLREGEADIVAIDGKTSRRSHARANRASRAGSAAARPGSAQAPRSPGHRRLWPSGTKQRPRRSAREGSGRHWPSP